MYDILLTIHNWFRYAVLALAIAAPAAAWGGYLVNRGWKDSDRRLSMLFTIALDIQLLLGLILYFISPITQAALADFGAAMESTELRFFGLEHVIYMLLAVAAAHIGSTLARRADQPRAKFLRAAVGFTLALIFILIGIPWWRPLLRI